MTDPDVAALIDTSADLRPTPTERIVAGLEVFLCSDFPTQHLVGATLLAFGFRAQAEGGALRLSFVALLTFVDALVLIGLMLVFLIVRGERPSEVFFGRRPILGELRAGIPLTFVAYALAIAILLTVRLAAPWMHTVEHNPLQDLIHTPGDAAVFALVILIGGGLREELQRAFVLHRFEQSLGGGAVGMAVWSIAFGAGHWIQGADAALATGLLGAFWGIVYLRRRSVLAPMVSHAGFDLLELVQFVAISR